MGEPGSGEGLVHINANITLSTMLLHEMLIVNVCGEDPFQRFQFQ